MGDFMRCAYCDERFDPKEDTESKDIDDVIMVFHPECWKKYKKENNLEGKKVKDL